MAEVRRDIVVTARLSRKIYYRFREFCRANRVSVYQGIENALEEVLEQAGVPPSRDWEEEQAPEVQ